MQRRKFLRGTVAGGAALGGLAAAQAQDVTTRKRSSDLPGSSPLALTRCPAQSTARLPCPITRLTRTTW